MDRYLLESKRNLEKLDTFTKVHVVLGNEACDLDSAVSAIVTAYLLHELQPVATLLVVPVLNIARKDVTLRTEITYFFEQVDISLDTLVCRDEIDLKKLHSQSKLSLTLVDHNLLPKEDADLQAAVQEVIDHHRLETSHRCDKTVEMVGSCCTLVAEKVLHSKPDLLSPQVALLLYGTILLDTVCLSESARKTTAKDLEMVSKLQALLPELSKEEVFKPLCRARSNVDGLCLDELLRKDLKAVCSSAKRIAISSVPGELKSICQENTMEAELGKFCKTHGYSALIILTIAVEEKSNSVQRQLAVFSSDIMLKQQLTSTLLAVGDPSLDLQVSHMSTDHLITFVQGNTQASRKVILPVVKKFLSTLDDNIMPKMNEHCPQTNGSLSVNNQPCAPTTASSPEDTALRDPPFSPSDSSNSMSETAKDGGTEKVNDESFDSAVDADAPSQAAFLYRAQTVDFPDSPHLRSAQRKTGSTCGEDETDDEVLSRGDHMSVSETRRASSSPLLAQVSNLQLSQPLSLASELEEYYEDSLLSGRLAVPNLEKSSLSAPLTISSSSPEFESENEEAEPTSLPSFGFSSQNDDSYAQVKHSTPNASKTSLDPAIELYSDDVARINLHNLPPSLDNGNSFLFEEKASGELPDEELVVKIRRCFDETKIKDGYVLTGRLQDLLTPKEVDEIVNNYVSYSSFIDDNILEAVVELAGGSQSLKNSNSHQSREKKVIVPNLEPFTDDSSDIVVVAYEEDDISSSLCSNGNKTASLEKKSAPHCGDGDGHGVLETETFHSLKRIDVEESVLKKLHMLPGTGIASRFMADSSRSLSSLPADLSQPEQEVKMNTARSDPELPVMALAERPLNSSVSAAAAADAPPELVSEERLQENDSSTPAERPSSLSGANRSRRKIKVNPDILRAQIGLDDDQKSLSSMSNKSDGDVFSPADDLATPDIETPDELGDSVLERDDSTLSDSIPEMSAREEYAEERSWKTCNVGGVERKIDMRVIEPYKKVLSHGGYFAEDRQAIIVFSACHLPDRCRRDYDYVMDNLFLYVLSTLDQLVVESYVLIYLHGATERSKMPSFGWLKRCYQMIDRRLRKNLKGLYLVHPTFWLKTIVIMTRPFISSKFSRKLRFVYSLEELSWVVPLDHVCIPDKVKQLEFENMIKEKKKKLGSRKVLPGPRQVKDDAS
ncbi:protein prune homolog 2-like isoform X2 [Dermacentor albipictus]|uniref:protein prune homolog 2-like isoform X2 n=1 Tax=Dermacentor albipictus TaxID=60249 RepID=UPI0038FCC005